VSFRLAFLGAALFSGAAHAQAPSAPRCDPFRTAVTLDLCKDSVTLSASASRARETYSASYTDIFGNTSGRWTRWISTDSTLSASWTPLEFLRVGISGTLNSGRSINSRTQYTTFSIYSKDTPAARLVPGVNAKLRLWQGEAFSGEHRFFVTADGQIFPSRRVKWRDVYSAPFSIEQTGSYKEARIPRESLGLESSHSWRITEGGLHLVSQNYLDLARREHVSVRDYKLESRLLLTDMTRGVALGPLVQVHDSSPRGTHTHSYVQAGLAGYVQPFRNSDIAGLRGLVLDSTISWLTRRHMDRPVSFLGVGTGTEPRRTRTQLYARARYTFEY
jgi:hypothetical protein